jgi:hypothetical protein
MHDGHDGARAASGGLKIAARIICVVCARMNRGSMIESERLDLLAFIRADKAKAVQLDRVDRLARLERALMEWPKLSAAAAPERDVTVCSACEAARARNAARQKRHRQKARKLNWGQNDHRPPRLTMASD